MKLTLEEFKTAYPDLFAEIETAAHSKGLTEGLERGRAEGIEQGASAERERIRGVESQLIVGHEALINELKFDGKTTGPEAAVKVLAAEREVMKTKHDTFTADSPKVIPPAEPADVKAEATDDKLPLEEKAKKDWDSKPELRNEFKMGGFNAYLAYLKNEQNVRILVKPEK